MKSSDYSVPPLQMAEVLLSLTWLKGLRNRKALELFSASADKLGYLDSREIFLSLAREWSDSDDRHEEVWDKCARRLAECEEVGVEAIPFFDDHYPERLRDIEDPPVVLFARGQINALHSPRSVAIVGTRKPTDLGERAAQDAGRLAAQSGITVVSGLALGCDAKAHEGCVEEGGVGVAVLAHGLDRVYPAANRDLADQLLDRGGCLVSELPVSAKPTRWSFAYRDRIQSGLADRVLVIETDVKGGTMYTVDFSRKQGRPLACIDHPQAFLSAGQTRGNQKLIEEGTAVAIADQAALERFFGEIPVPPNEEEITSEPALPAEQLSLPL